MSHGRFCQPENIKHRWELIARHGRVLTREEVQLFREDRLIMRDEEGNHYACIAIGSMLLTAERLFDQVEELRDELAKSFANTGRKVKKRKKKLSSTHRGMTQEQIDYSIKDDERKKGWPTCEG